MRLFLSVALLMVTGMSALGLRADCSPGSTVVLVNDCSGAPVQGARIDIKICCAGNQTRQRSAVSASNGEATFDINAKEICDGTVKFAGFSATSFGTGSCTAPGKEGKSKCTVQVCKR
jgi:streptogramin lyase